MDETANDSNRPSLFLAFVPVLVLIGLLGVNVALYSDNATGGPNQIALILAAAVAGIVGRFLGIRFRTMLQGIASSLSSAIGAILILLMIGSLAGTWMLSGVVPAMIYYGLEVIDPRIFLFASVVVCSIVSVATGSSWTTVATVGVALVGIGQALDVHLGMTIGAIISGAYFGDKISPLSDTTNLASAMAGTELFTHIRYMLWTTVPSICIALAIFLAIGLSSDVSTAGAGAESLSLAIDEKFNLNPLLFLVPLAVIGMVIFKVDALVALFVGTILGAVFAVIFQPNIIAEVGGDGSYFQQAYIAVINAMSSGFAIESENAAAADLLSAGGMAGMLNTIWLVVCAMSFGGVMEACGLLKRITDPLVDLAKSTGSLVATTVGACLFTNFTASDQYLAIVVPGRMFRETYQDRGLAPENLSRTLEDSGTVTSVLVPWNTCCAYHTGVLGGAIGATALNPLIFIPYCLFNIISPLMTILVAFVGFKISELKPDSQPETI
jgi:NhaC family Na+:H+ antiporter